MATWVQGIENDIKVAAGFLSSGDASNACLHICVAIDATAKKQYPKYSVGERFKEFVAENTPLITTFAFGCTIGRGMRIKCDHPKIRADKDGLCGLEDMVYYALRCPRTHEAKISTNITLVAEPVLQVTRNSEIISPAFLCGLIAAVVCSPTNANVLFDPALRLGVANESIALNDLRGIGEAAVEKFRAIRGGKGARIGRNARFFGGGVGFGMAWAGNRIPPSKT